MATEQQIKLEQQLIKLQEESIALSKKYEGLEDKRLTNAKKMKQEILSLNEKIKDLEKDIADELKEQEKIETRIDGTLESLSKKHAGILKSMKFGQVIENKKRGMASQSVKLQEKSLTTLKKNLQMGRIDRDLAEEQLTIQDEINSGEMTSEQLKSKSASLGEQITTANEELNQALAFGTEEEKKAAEAKLQTLQLTKDILDNEFLRVDANDKINKAQELQKQGIDKIGDSIGIGLVGPLSVALGILALFNSQQEAIADQFGALGVTEFRDELAGASQEFTKLGFTAAEAQTTISNLSNEFGISVSEASKLSGTISEVAKATGTTLEDSTKLVGLFTQTQGLTAKQSEDLIKSTQALAKANDVAPDKVLGDIANSTETFAKFADKGGKNILRAAIQARKLGTNLEAVAGAAEGFLDFQTSLNAEVEASILLGRDVNLQKARELALAGDLEGVQTEIVNQLGSAEQFSKLNVIQRKSLASAVGLELSQVEKIVNKQKEQVTLAGELSKQSTENLVSSKTITATAALLNNLKALGMELAENLGPSINLVIGAFSSTIGILNELGALLPLISGYVAFLTAKTVANTVATIAKARADRLAAKAALTGAGADAAKAAAQTAAAIPVVGFALAAAGLVVLGTAIASFMGSFKTGTKLGGVKQDGVAALHSGETILNEDDTKMLEEQQAAMKGGTVGGTTNVTNVDTSKLEAETKSLKAEMEHLRKDMASYFGFGGSVAGQIGGKFKGALGELTG